MIKVRPAAERVNRVRTARKLSHVLFQPLLRSALRGLSQLRVINEDFVAPGTVSALTHTTTWEIISYVLEGALLHRDSAGGSGVIPP